MFTKNQCKNLGQNQDKLKNFLVKDYEYSPEMAETLIDEAVQANSVKSIMFNGKISYRIAKKDSFGGSTILVPDTQANTSEDERTDADTVILEESTTNIIEKGEEIVSVLIDKKFSSLIEHNKKRVDNLEDEAIGL